MNAEHELFLMSISQSGEVWKDAVGYKNLYAVSNIGRIARLSRITIGNDGKTYPFRCRLLSPYKDCNGYMVVGLYKDGKTTYKKVHAVVVESFIGEIPKNMEIDHIDCNRSNNTLSNLRICSHKENINNPITKSKFRNPKPSSYSFTIERTDKYGNTKIYDSVHNAVDDGFSFYGVYRACKFNREYKGFSWRYGEKTKKQHYQRTCRKVFSRGQDNPKGI
jgi:hypothetical protein